MLQAKVNGQRNRGRPKRSREKDVNDWMGPVYGEWDEQQNIVLVIMTCQSCKTVYNMCPCNPYVRHQITPINLSIPGGGKRQ